MISDDFTAITWEVLPRRRERLVAAQGGVHFARQHGYMPCPSRRHVSHHLLSPTPPNKCFSHRSSLQNDAVDISREAQIASIENSFAAARCAEHLSALRHLTKPCLRAVAAYEVLPDADVCANAYDPFRFSERPGKCRPEVCFCGCLPPPYGTTDRERFCSGSIVELSGTISPYSPCIDPSLIYFLVTALPCSSIQWHVEQVGYSLTICTSMVQQFYFFSSRSGRTLVGN